MRYFVTGATGFIGSRLAKRLLERDGSVLYFLVRSHKLASGRRPARTLGRGPGAGHPRGGRPDPAAPGDCPGRPGAAAREDRPLLPPGRGLRPQGERARPRRSPTWRARVTPSSSPTRSRPAACISSARLPPPDCTRACSARTCSRRPRTSSTLTSAPSTSPSASCATECKRPWRIYRPGIVVGDSRTGEMDKIDGPYYFFKPIQKLRRLLPPWMPAIGLEGGRLNLVPVDFVTAAMDHIAHQPGLDGRCFHLDRPQPAPGRRPAQHLRACRPRARDDPAREHPHVRLHPRGRAARPRADETGAPHRRADHAGFRIAAGRAAVRQLPDPLRQPRGPARARPAPGSRSRRSRATPGSCGTTGSGIWTRSCSSIAASRAR